MSKQAEIRMTLTVLLLIFIVLKLVGVIAWSWWWVFAPMWVPAIVGVALIMFSTVLMKWIDK